MRYRDDPVRRRRPRAAAAVRARRAVAVAVAALAAGGHAASASASAGQATYFDAPRDLVGVSAARRARTFAELRSLGVDGLRVVVYWERVAPQPRSARAPRFDAADPSAYDWSAYDPVLATAKALGWRVLLTVSGPVPRWATASRRDEVTRPDPLDFERFMTAVARRYAGKVSLFSIWNEPNHPAFLQPQFVHGQPASPRLYRALWQAGYAGLVAGGIAHPAVLFGETAPTGSPHDVAPLVFLRDALCLNVRYHKAATCSQLPAAGYAHHAYTIPAGPYYRPPVPDDVTIGALSRLVGALDRAARAHAIRARLPIYLTEFGVQSHPNRWLGVSPAVQAQFDAICEMIAWENPRVAAFSQYLLRDDATIDRPGNSLSGLGTGFQTGLEYANGRPKPLYAGFRLPLVVMRARAGFNLWGYVRPARGATGVTVLVQRSRRAGFTVLARRRTDTRGYWQMPSRVRGVAWRVRWRAPAGITYTGPPIAAY